MNKTIVKRYYYYAYITMSKSTRSKIMNNNNFKTVKAGVLENSTFDELKKEIEDFELSKPLTKVDFELNEKSLKSISEEYGIPEDKVERLLNSIVLID